MLASEFLKSRDNRFSAGKKMLKFCVKARSANESRRWQRIEQYVYSEQKNENKQTQYVTKMTTHDAISGS